MMLRDMDLNRLSKLASQQVDHVTCIECCKYYTVPTTASCGHTLCHCCWRGRRICALCGKSIEKKNLKLNIPLQNLTEHVSFLSKTLEDLFNIKLDEYLLESPAEKNPDDPNKNVKEWLASSQNQFSAPITNSTQSTQGQMETGKVTSDIQVHTEQKRIPNPTEVIHIPLQQDDWDNIEELPDTENNNKNQENIVGPMDIEPFDFMMDDEYTTHNPRRSSRQREGKINNPDVNQVNPPKKNSSRDSNKGSETKSLKVAKNWNKVKRIKKEFSKLNKKYRNKLNVSIEMCKNTQNINKKKIQISKEKLYGTDNKTQEIVNNDKSDVPINNNNDVIKNKCVTEPDNMSSSSDNNNISKNHKTIETDVNNEVPAPRIAFIKKSTFLNRPEIVKDDLEIAATNPSRCVTANNDDIEISIKVGNTLTNICIKKKDNDVHFKINSDREVQTSLDCCNNEKDVSNTNIVVNNMEGINTIKNNCTPTTSKNVAEVSVSKKNTASADTTTASFEIIKSIEEEMIKSMGINQGSGKKKHMNSKNILQENTSQTQPALHKINEIPEDMDLDIFDSESVKEANVVTLKSTKNTPSAILPSIRTAKLKTPTNDKRDRERDSGYELPSSKKRKITPQKEILLTHEINDKVNIVDSENVNDEMLCQILDKIDSRENVTMNERETIKSQINKSFDKSSQKSFVNKSINNKPSEDNLNEKYSENVFSILENDSQILKTFNYKTQAQSQHPKSIDINKNTTNKSKTTAYLDAMDLCTPVQDEDSDKSVVEDTPQKTSSFTKMRNKNDNTSNSNMNVTVKQNSRTKNVDVQNDIDYGNILSDTVGESIEKSENITVVETLPQETLETPVTITKFVDQIKHKSTPVARKSLKFNYEKSDPDVTMCQSSFVLAKNTQEKEFLSKAFEQTIDSDRVRSNRKVLKFCIAGSCLTASEQTHVKLLCSQRNWSYVEKYTKDLTHLVVGVDEGNIAQRSVKFMCAIAGGKWIVSYEWIEKCLETNSVVDEEQFEALDATGEPGPRRSRLAKQKLFTGIGFYCMPPFKVLDVDTLKDILECSGGRVVLEASEARASANPVLMLAEPEHTQEDRFTYIAMELSVVPVNYEWVLNCLGSYSLESIYELLLCPVSLLPPVVAKWPPELISRDVK